MNSHQRRLHRRAQLRSGEPVPEWAYARTPLFMRNEPDPPVEAAEEGPTPALAAAAMPRRNGFFSRLADFFRQLVPLRSS